MSTHEIEIEYGERYTDFVMGMYVDISLADDLDMLGWNLCDCDDAVFQEKIGNCRIDLETQINNNARIIIRFLGQDETLQVQVVEEFLDNWGEFVQHQRKGIVSRV